MNASLTPSETARHNAHTPTYVPPKVTSIGCWQAVTLVGSVPVNRMLGIPGGTQ